MFRSDDLASDRFLLSGRLCDCGMHSHLVAISAALAPLAPPRAAVPHACAATGLYAPFVERGMQLFAEAGLELQPYDIDDDLRARDATTGTGARQHAVRLRSSAYCTDVLRQIRLVLIDGGERLQVLNFCIFPHLQYGLPTFALDLVTLPGGHLIALDCQPNGHADAEASGLSSALADAFSRHRDALPDGGPIPEAAEPYFSPHFLWSRMPLSVDGDAVIDAVLPAFEDYLTAYLRQARRRPPAPTPPAPAPSRAPTLAGLASRRWRARRLWRGRSSCAPCARRSSIMRGIASPPTRRGRCSDAYSASRTPSASSASCSSTCRSGSASATARPTVAAAARAASRTESERASLAASPAWGRVSVDQ